MISGSCTIKVPPTVTCCCDAHDARAVFFYFYALCIVSQVPVPSDMYQPFRYPLLRDLDDTTVPERRAFREQQESQGRKLVTAVREKCDDDEDRLERLAFCSVKAGPRVTICRATLPSDLRFAMLVGCLAGSIIKPRAWDCPGNKLRSQWEQSAGSLCPNRCPRARGGCEQLRSTFGPYQSGAGHGATAVGECRTSA